MLEFKYQYINTRGIALVIPRAIVTVHFCLPSGDQDLVQARIDSGGDYSVFPIAFANKLGISLSAEPQNLAAAYGSQQSQIRAYEGLVDLCLRDLSGRSAVWQAKVFFSDAPSQEVQLGYVGFREFFDVSFGRKHFTITPRPPVSEATITDVPDTSVLAETTAGLTFLLSSDSMSSVTLEAEPNSEDTSKTKTGDSEASSDPIPSEDSTLLTTQSRYAFVRDLPVLLKTKPKQWVAYSGDKQIAFDRASKARLVQECLRRGYSRGTFVIFRIEPHETPELDFVPDV